MAAGAAEGAGLLRPGKNRRPTPAGVKLLICLEYGWPFLLLAVLGVVALHPALRDSLLSEVETRSLLPDRVAMCYASWDECDDRIVLAARQGCNVIAWFAINFVDTGGAPTVRGGPDLACVRKVMSKHFFLARRNPRARSTLGFYSSLTLANCSLVRCDHAGSRQSRSVSTSTLVSWRRWPRR